MASLFKHVVVKKSSPLVGDVRVKIKLLLFPRLLFNRQAQLEFRWLGVERVIYRFERWKSYCPGDIRSHDVIGWRAKKWY